MPICIRDFGFDYGFEMSVSMVTAVMGIGMVRFQMGFVVGIRIAVAFA